MTSRQLGLRDSPDKAAPIIHLDVTKDDPLWQKVSANNVKYPPLRFLSRDVPSPVRRSPAWGDDSSDYSFSSVDTTICVSNTSPHRMPDPTADTNSPERELPNSDYNGYGSVNERVTVNGYDHSVDMGSFDISDRFSEQCALSEGTNYEESYRLSNYDRTSMHNASLPSGSLTEVGRLQVGQPQSLPGSPSTDGAVVERHDRGVDKTTMWQSSSGSQIKTPSPDFKSGRQHLTPTNHIHTNASTQDLPNRWTLADEPLASPERPKSPIYTGDWSSRNRNISSIAPNGMVNGYQNDFGPTEESMSLLNQLSPNSDTMSDEVETSYQSPYKEETLIHTLHGDNVGSVPETAGTDEVNMKGMYHTQGDSEENNIPPDNGQQLHDRSHDLKPGMPVEKGILKDMPLTHPAISFIQNDNNSDTSSVDSDGVPYKKSNLKRTQSPHDGSNRTGRKVRFAEPLEELEENKPIQLSARERLGLTKSTGGNVYTYVPSFGLKKQLGAEEKREEPVLPQPSPTKSKKSVRFTEDTKFETSSTDSEQSDLVREQLINNIYNDTSRIITNSNEPDYSPSNPSQQRYVEYESARSTGVLGGPELTDKVIVSTQTPSPSPPRNRIIRRPGIHVTRPKSDVHPETVTVSPPRLTNPHSVILDSASAAAFRTTQNHQNYTSESELSQQNPYTTPGSRANQRPESPVITNNYSALLRTKNNENIQRTQDARFGKLFDRTSTGSTSSDNQSPGYLMNGGDHYQPPHVKLGHKVLPDMGVIRLSQSSSDNTLSDQRRNSGALPENRTDFVSFNGIHPNQTAPKIVSPRASQQRFPGPGADLAVVPLQGETSSVPSPVSGDSGISSSSSLTELNSPADPLGDNYSTLTYIQRGKTKNVMDRQRSQGNMGPPRNSPQPANLVRRDSGRNENRREIMSDISVGGGVGPLDEWRRSVDRSPRDDSQVTYDPRRDDSQVTYDPRRVSTTSQSSEMPPPQAWQPRDQHYRDQYHRDPSPSPSYQRHPDSPYSHRDEDIYERLRNSSTNRVPSKSKLVAIPQDILNPRPQTPQLPQRTEPFLPPERTPQSVQRRENFGNPRYSFANDDDSSLYSGYSNQGHSSNYGPSQGNHPQQAHGRHHNGYGSNQQLNKPPASDNTPQYSSSADILKMLQNKTRNPFVKPEGYG